MDDHVSLFALLLLESYRLTGEENRECRSSRTRFGRFDSRFARCTARCARTNYRSLTRRRDQSILDREGTSRQALSRGIDLDVSPL